MPDRKPARFSAKPAELAANAVLAGPRKERAQAAARRTRFAAWLYPEPKRFPPLMRLRVLADAKSAAYTKGRVARVLTVLLGISAVVLIWIVLGSAHRTRATLACVVLVLVAQAALRYVAMRQYVRHAAWEFAKTGACGQ